MVEIPKQRIPARPGFSPMPRTEQPTGGIPDAEKRRALAPPVRRGFSSIPAPEVLERLIAQAVDALRNGLFWDRGSILNLLV